MQKLIFLGEDILARRHIPMVYLTFQEILDSMIQELERQDVKVLSSSMTMAVLESIAHSQTLLYNNLAAAITVPKDFNWLGNPSTSTKKHVWPDGLPMYHLPKDGATWSNKDGDWVWDGFAEIWFKHPNQKKYNYNEEYLKAKDSPAVCECGSEKVGSSAHSSWCAKYEP